MFHVFKLHEARGPFRKIGFSPNDWSENTTNFAILYQGAGHKLSRGQHAFFEGREVFFPKSNSSAFKVDRSCLSLILLPTRDPMAFDVAL